MKKYLLRLATFASVVSLATSLVLPLQRATALTGTDWQAGRIIDDAVFSDPNTMSVADIQNFLNQKVGTGYYGRNAGQCDTNGDANSEWGGGTRAQYGAANGNPAPFTCLKDYYEVPKTSPGPNIPASNYGGVPIPAGAKSAAQLIWDAGQKYQISPKVLLVMIQKESAGPLITDDWPFKKQYTYAMGAHCPDTTGCDVNYSGFSIQISESARLLRYYLDNMDQPWWTYKKLGTNQVLYNPNSSCGSGAVNITSRATAALYTYTPYQPNQAALNNLYGSGDGCSSYGNRNFWRIFTDWFGSTQTNIPYAWSPLSQEAYLDPAMTKSANVSMLAPDQTIYVRIVARNIGFQTWANSGSNPVRVGTNNPRDHVSDVCTPDWLSCTRPAALKEASVTPGNVGTFEFPMKTPHAYGTYYEHYSLLAEGASWMNDVGYYWPLSVKPPNFTWNFVSQGTYSDSSMQYPINPQALSPNTKYYLQLKLRNTGNATWTNSGPNPVNLGTSRATDRASAFCDSSWLNCTRPSTLKESSVKPGETGTFEFWVNTPSTYGSFQEYFRPVVEGVGWMNDLGQNWNFDVKSPTYAWQIKSQLLYTDQARTTPVPSSGVPNNTKIYATITARNTGNATWTNSGPNPVRLATNNPKDRASTFCDSSWLGCNRPAGLKETSVLPGHVGTFEFEMTTPYRTNGTVAKEYFNLVTEGKMWMNDIGMYLPIKFNSALNTWQFVSQSTYTDSARSQSANLSNASKNTTYYLRLKAKNISGQTWQKSTLRLGTSNPQDRISAFCTSTWLSCNRAAGISESTVPPGSVATFDFSVKTPSATGTYDEYFRPVIDGQTWLLDLGQYWEFITH